MDEFNKVVDYERNDNDCIDNWKYNDFAVNVSVSKIWNRKKKEGIAKRKKSKITGIEIRT